MSDIVVYGTPPLPDVQTVRMTLVENDVEYEVQPFQPGSPEMEGLHPLGKVPALTHGDVRLFETLAICSYIDETFGRLQLHPSSPAERARMLQWWSFYNEECHPCVVQPILLPRLLSSAAGTETDETTIAAAVPAARRRLEILDKALCGRQWFANAKVSLADFAIAPMVEQVSQAPEGEQLLGGLDRLRGWLDRMRERESFRRTRAA